MPGRVAPVSLRVDAAVLEQVRRDLEARCGLVFGEHNVGDLERGILATVEELGLRASAEVVQLLAGGDAHTPAFESLIRNVTVGETYFFRDSDQFESLRSRILPELIARRRASEHLSLRIWSAGCATGEEAYSLSMVLHELLPDIDKWKILLLATDINRSSLERARQAEFGDWSFRGVPDSIRGRYFQGIEGEQTHARPRFRLQERVRRLVHFEHLNLRDSCYPSLLTNTTALDVVLCRNVLIYFSPNLVGTVIERLCESIIVGGWLLVGPTEPDVESFRSFEQVEAGRSVVFRKRHLSAPEIRASQQSGVGVRRRAALRPHPGAAEPRPARRPRAPATAVGRRVEAARQVSRATREAGVAHRLAVGIQAWELGDYGEARDIFTRISKEASGRWEPYFWLARIAADCGDHEAAEGWLDRAIQLERLDVRPYHLQAVLCADRGDTIAGITALKRALFLDRSFVMGHFRLAMLYERDGRDELATRSLRNTRKLLLELDDAEILPGVEEIEAGFLLKLVEKRLDS